MSTTSRGDMQVLFIFTTSSVNVQDASLSTTSRGDMQVLFISTASSVDVQSVSLPNTSRGDVQVLFISTLLAMWTCRVYPCPPPVYVGVQGVSLSTWTK
jgi:hypothetical protein